LQTVEFDMLSKITCGQDATTLHAVKFVIGNIISNLDSLVGRCKVPRVNIV